VSADLSVGVADPLPLPLSELELLGNLPVEQVVPTRAVAKAVREAGRRLVVLDDDPTGTQTVAGVPVLTRWREDDLRWAFRQPSRAF
jgi:hypothetical protein